MIQFQAVRQKFSVSILLVTAFIIGFSCSVEAALDFGATQSQLSTKVPQGASKYPVLYFTAKATGADSLTGLTIKNAAPTVKFRDGITTVYLYKASDTGDFASATLLASKQFNTLEPAPLTYQFSNFSVSFTDQQSVGFYVVYDISSTVQIGATTNLQVVQLNTTTVTGSSCELTITGLAGQVATSLAPIVVVPNQLDVSMLKISLRPSGEDIIDSTLYPITFTIQNSQSNFSNTAGDTTGVTAVSLYQELSNGTLTLLKKLSGTQFTSKSEVTFTNFLNTLTIAGNTTTNFYIKYDMGVNLPVTANSSVCAQLKAFSGTGASSTSSQFTTKIALATAIPPSSAQSYCGGLTYSNVASIVPANNVFGPGTSVPILQFRLAGTNVPVTLNQVTIQNSGTIQYITEKTDTSGVVRIRLFEDTNNDYVYDGEGQGDTLIGTLNLGYGSGQSKTLAPITIPNGFLIPSSDSTIDNSKLFFVIYDFGVGISASANATAELYNAASSTNYSTDTLKLSGTLPVTGGTVTSQKINIRVQEITSIVSDSAIQGQVKVPMVYIRLRNEETTKGSVLQILNNKASFLDNNTGVSKIWVYRDDNANRVLDSGDTLLTATTQFKTLLRADLPAIDLSQGDNNLFICYDIGQKSVISTSNIACQLENITSTGNGTTVLFGGERPVPKVAAVVTVNAALLSVSQTVCSTANISNATPTFSVDIKVDNSSTRNISITDAYPRFYLTQENGPDVSYEFTINRISDLPVTINAGSSVTLNFNVVPAHLVSTGSALIDAVVKYQNTPGNYAELSRYQTSGGLWNLAAAQYSRAKLSSTVNVYDFQTPEYIDSVKVEYGSQKYPFRNYDSIPADSNFWIYFKDQGKFIDDSKFKVTINVSVNDQAIVATDNPANATSPYYQYDRQRGVLAVYRIGTQSGSLALSVSDLSGNLLKGSDRKFPFYISDKLQIHDFLCYPNPFRVNSTLRFGFSITQPAPSATLYLFNSNGQLIWQYQTSLTSIGYQEIDWDGTVNGQLLGSGIYIVKLVAVDSNANKVTAVTKLAVY